MPAGRPFRVRIVDWRDAGDTLSRIRTIVFVDEQRVSMAIERDGRDAECVHVQAETQSGEAIGTGRLMPDGRIGRMAVLAAWRGKGVGAAMLELLMDEARKGGHREAYLFAQGTARHFYARQGFVAEGEEHLEAGIPHIWMRAQL